MGPRASLSGSSRDSGIQPLNPSVLRSLCSRLSPTQFALTTIPTYTHHCQPNLRKSIKAKMVSLLTTQPRPLRIPITATTVYANIPSLPPLSQPNSLRNEKRKPARAMRRPRSDSRSWPRSTTSPQDRSRRSRRRSRCSRSQWTARRRA